MAGEIRSVEVKKPAKQSSVKRALKIFWTTIGLGLFVTGWVGGIIIMQSVETGPQQCSFLFPLQTWVIAGGGTVGAIVALVKAKNV